MFTEAFYVVLCELQFTLKFRKKLGMIVANKLT